MASLRHSPPDCPSSKTLPFDANFPRTPVSTFGPETWERREPFVGLSVLKYVSLRAGDVAEVLFFSPLDPSLHPNPDLTEASVSCFSRISCGFLLIFSYFSVHRLNVLQLLKNLSELYGENNVNIPTGKRCTAMNKWIKQYAKQDALWCDCLPTNLSSQNKLQREKVRFTFQAISDSLQSLAGPEGYFRLPRHFPSSLQTLWLKPEGKESAPPSLSVLVWEGWGRERRQNGYNNPKWQEILLLYAFVLGLIVKLQQKWLNRGKEWQPAGGTIIPEQTDIQQTLLVNQTDRCRSQTKIWVMWKQDRNKWTHRCVWMRGVIAGAGV